MVQLHERELWTQPRLEAQALLLTLWLCVYTLSPLIVSDSFVTPLTVAHQAPLIMRCPRQECWSGLHFLLQGIFLTQGLNLSLLQWQAESLLLSYLGSPWPGEQQDIHRSMMVAKLMGLARLCGRGCGFHPNPGLTKDVTTWSWTPHVTTNYQFPHL